MIGFHPPVWAVRNDPLFCPVGRDRCAEAELVTDHVSRAVNPPLQAPIRDLRQLLRREGPADPSDNPLFLFRPRDFSWVRPVLSWAEPAKSIRFVTCFSQRSRSLNLSGVTRVSRPGWTIVVCTLALVFLTEFAWADPFRVVAIGASNTSGWIVSSEQAYPRVLEQMLRTAGYEVQITNSGRPFDTTAGMLTRLDSAVPDRTDLVDSPTRSERPAFFRVRGTTGQQHR